MTVEEIRAALERLSIPDMKFVVDDYRVEGFTSQRSLKIIKEKIKSVVTLPVGPNTARVLKTTYDIVDPVQFIIDVRNFNESDTLSEVDMMSEALYANDWDIQIRIGRADNDNSHGVALLTAYNAGGRVVSTEKFSIVV